ncbi:MAG: PEP-CTERM sorting domain-containing protein [Bryobacteraceae bacterium]
METSAVSFATGGVRLDGIAVHDADGNILPGQLIATPEPHSWIYLLLGLAGLCLRRRIGH